MTMQTNSLPFQVSGANPINGAGAVRSATPDKMASSSANGGFGATLSREIAQRQPAQQTPAPAQSQAPKQTQQQSKPNAADKPAQREPTPQAGAKPAADGNASAGAGTSASAKTAQTDESAASEDTSAAVSEAAAAATTPVTDMLAFMASLTRPATEASTGASLDTGSAAAAAGQQPGALEDVLQNVKGKAPGAGDGPALAAGVTPDTLEAAAQGAGALPQGEADLAQFGAHLREARQAAPVAASEEPVQLTALQTQAAKLAETQAPAAVPGDRIPARVGTQAWDNQVSQRIVYMVGKEQSATLTLNPPDLGPVQIVLNVSNDQASVAFSSQQLEVRQALENAMPRLREMMSESGIALGNATVDSGAANQHNHQDSERRAQGGNGNPNGVGGTGQGEVALNEVAPRATRTVVLGDSGMVDLFA